MKLISWGIRVIFLGLITGCVPQVQVLEQQAVSVANQVVSIYLLLFITFILVIIFGIAFFFRNNPRLRRLWAPPVNKLGQLFGWSPIYVLPSMTKDVKEENQLVHEALNSLRDIKSLLKRNPTLSVENKRSIQVQIEHIPPNLIKSVKQLEHLRRIAKTADKYQREEIDKMDFKLQVQIQHSLQTLKAIPIELMKIELASTDRTIKRLVNDLTETNDRLRDLEVSSTELNKRRSRLEH